MSGLGVFVWLRGAGAVRFLAVAGGRFITNERAEAGADEPLTQLKGASHEQRPGDRIILRVMDMAELQEIFPNFTRQPLRSLPVEGPDRTGDTGTPQNADHAG